MSLIKEYFELTNKYYEIYGQQMILLMQVGSFFEVYGKKIKNERRKNHHSHPHPRGAS